MKAGLSTRGTTTIRASLAFVKRLRAASRESGRSMQQILDETPLVVNQKVVDQGSVVNQKAVVDRPVVDQSAKPSSAAVDEDGLRYDRFEDAP